MLRTIEVGKWTVSQAGMREAVRRMTMVKRVQALHERGELDEELLTALGIYPNLAGCISPEISIDEFLQIPETDLDQLTSAAIELNPHWYSTPDQEKKTDEQPPIYTTS